MKELVNLVVEFDGNGTGGRLAWEPINKAEPETRDQPISPEEMRKTLREMKRLALLFAPVYVRGKRPPSELEELRLHIRRECSDAGYSRLAPIFIKEIETEIEKAMARQPAPEPTE